MPPPSLTEMTFHANVATLGVGLQHAQGGHLIRLAADGNVIGIVGAGGASGKNPITYRTTDIWATLSITKTFTVEDGVGTQLMTSFEYLGANVFAGIYDSTNFESEVWRSTDDGQTWAFAQVAGGPAADNFRPYAYLAMSNGDLLLGNGQANPEWWVDAGGGGAAFANQGNWAGEGSDRMVCDAVEVGTTGTLVVATIQRLSMLGAKTVNIYTGTSFGTGTVTLRQAVGPLTPQSPSWPCRLYNIPGTTIVLASIPQAAGNNNIWRSTDGGVTWAQISSTEGAHGDFLLLSTGQVIVGHTSHAPGTGQGVYVSGDQGATWTFIDLDTTGAPGVSNRIFTFLEVGGFLYAAGIANGDTTSSAAVIWRSNDLTPEPPPPPPAPSVTVAGITSRLSLYVTGAYRPR